MYSSHHKSSFISYCIWFTALVFTIGGCSDSNSEPNYFFEYSVEGEQFRDVSIAAQNINSNHLFITHRAVNGIQLYLVPEGSLTLPDIKSLSLEDVTFRCTLNYYEYENADVARFTRVFSAGDRCMLQLTEWENTHDNVVVLSGDFSGIVISDDGEQIVISNGRFRLPTVL